MGRGEYGYRDRWGNFITDPWKDKDSWGKHLAAGTIEQLITPGWVTDKKSEYIFPKNYRQNLLETSPQSNTYRINLDELLPEESLPKGTATRTYYK